MSIPHSKVLSVSKGFGLGAEFHNNSPSSTQVVNVNINKAAESVPEQSNSVKGSGQSFNESANVVYPSECIALNAVEPNPYNNLNEPPQESPEQDNKNNELQELLHYKDNVIEALSSLLNIVESNPLIINKLIVANIQDLSQLIKLLTNADTVQINTNNDIECSCLKDLDFVSVDKIYIVKGNDTLNFKYSFPDANKILDDHHVSVKLVRI